MKKQITLFAIIFAFGGLFAQSETKLTKEQISTEGATNAQVLVVNTTTGLLEWADQASGHTEEEIQDIVGEMNTGTESLIAVTYDDAGGKINYAVEPNLSNYTNDAGFLNSEVDGDVTNEIQDLTYNDATGQLDISGGGSGQQIKIGNLFTTEIFKDGSGFTAGDATITIAGDIPDSADDIFITRNGLRQELETSGTAVTINLTSKVVTFSRSLLASDVIKVTFGN